MDYVQDREHWLLLIRCIRLCWTLRSLMWVVVHACDELILLIHVFYWHIYLYVAYIHAVIVDQLRGSVLMCEHVPSSIIYWFIVWWWINQYHACCHLNHVSLIELSIEIFYEHLIWSCIILDPFIVYVSIFEVGRLTW